MSAFKYFSSESLNSNELMWKFCIGGNGQVLSIVQQTTLEMRTEKHYNKTIAKATCNIDYNINFYYKITIF